MSDLNAPTRLGGIGSRSDVDGCEAWPLSDAVAKPCILLSSSTGHSLTKSSSLSLYHHPLDILVPLWVFELYLVTYSGGEERRASSCFDFCYLLIADDFAATGERLTG